MYIQKNIPENSVMFFSTLYCIKSYVYPIKYHESSQEWAEMLTPWPLRRPLHEVMCTLDGRRWGGTESETLWELVGGHSAAVGPVRRGSLQLQPYTVYA